MFADPLIGYTLYQRSMWNLMRLSVLKRNYAVAVCLVLILSSCQLVQQPAPPSAIPSTPAADLPVNAAFQTRPTAVPAEIIEAADAEYLLLTNVYERVAPSVVNIDVTVRAMSPMFEDVASGSGIVYDTQGHIITNAHVINDAREIRVTFNDGYVAEAELIGMDVYSDLAVVRVQVDPSRLSPITFSDSDAVRVG